jgi:hypothetical protein
MSNYAEARRGVVSYNEKGGDIKLANGCKTDGLELTRILLGFCSMTINYDNQGGDDEKDLSNNVVDFMFGVGSSRGLR